MELEFIKRELYNQINLSRSLEKEKHGLCNQIVQIEEEMSTTIESYKAILTSNENESEKHMGSAKLEFANMTLQFEKYENER